MGKRGLWKTTSGHISQGIWVPKTNGEIAAKGRELTAAVEKRRVISWTRVYAMVIKLTLWLMNYLRIRLGAVTNPGSQEGSTKVNVPHQITMVSMWQVGLTGLRVGEAAVPGPGN